MTSPSLATSKPPPEYAASAMSREFEVKLRGKLGPEDGDDKAIRIVNRIVEWTEEGINYEADPRHAEIIVQQLGLGGKAATVTTPGTRQEAIGQEDDEELNQEDAKQYRRLAARASFLAQHRPDIQYSVQEIARIVSRPTRKAWQLLKIRGRYLKLKTRDVIRYMWQQGVLLLNVFLQIATTLARKRHDRLRAATCYSLAAID